MPMFQPKSDKDLSAENLLPAGEYDAEVSKAVNKRFQTGSEGIALTLMVYKPDGTARLVNDNLIFMDSCMFKVSNFCKAAGLRAQYEAGNLDANDCVGRGFKVKIGIEEANGEFAAKNKVKSYVVPKQAKQSESEFAEQEVARQQSKEIDDLIP